MYDLHPDSPFPTLPVRVPPWENLTATLCLTVAVLLASVGMSWSADFKRGWNAYRSGDFATALEEFLPLAQIGHDLAGYNLGVMYREGKGVGIDDKAAVKWWSLAALNGFAPAQANLGLMYDKGEGVTKDSHYALFLFQSSAEQGDLLGQYNLGLLYAAGGDIDRDTIRGLMWLKIAAGRGHQQASQAKAILETTVMSPAEIAKARDLALECVKNSFKEC